MWYLCLVIMMGSGGIQYYSTRLLGGDPEALLGGLILSIKDHPQAVGLEANMDLYLLTVFGTTPRRPLGGATESGGHGRHVYASVRDQSCEHYHVCAVVWYGDVFARTFVAGAE